MARLVYVFENEGSVVLSVCVCVELGEVRWGVENERGEEAKGKSGVSVLFISRYLARPCVLHRTNYAVPLR